jgi:UDP-glucuronate decarboxylase
MHNIMQNILLNDAHLVVSKVDFRSLKNKTILITGCTGLIGINLIASLRVLCERNEGPSNIICAAHSPIDSIAGSLFDFQEATVIRGDLSENINFLSNYGQFDFIIHSAGYGQPGKFMADPVKTLTLNTKCTLELFELLNSGGSFLFISTSEVYSGLEHSPFNESQIGTTNTDHQRACYIEAKRCGEAICNAEITRGFSAKSARVALSYGPGTKKDDHRVLNQFIQRALNDKKIILQDMGNAKRTYCYVSDTVETLWNILLHGKFSIYNVGGHSRTTIAELAQSIGNILDVPITFPVEEQDMTDAPADVSLDMKLAEDEFSKDSYIDIQHGLRATIEFQKALYANYNGE